MRICRQHRIPSAAPIFLTAENQTPRKLTGIVDADETYVLESQKGERNLGRKARHRGDKASKRGLSDEQVPVLVAVDHNHHAHLFSTTRKAEADGFGAKTQILDAAKTGGVEVARMREWWAWSMMRWKLQTVTPVSITAVITKS